MMEQLEKSMGFPLNPKNSPRRAGDSPQLIASIKKIERDLGWCPKATLKEMIDTSWAAEKGNA
jgi:UDP-glucose 4-epimerase